MRKILSLLLSVVLVIGLGIPSFASGTNSAIPKEIITLINPYNYSNVNYDESELVLKWLNQSGIKSEVLEAMVSFNSGVQLGGEFLDFEGYMTYREVVKPWAPLGKPDVKLGQAYESKVNLTMGQTHWENYLIHTKAWVKKAGANYTVTKIQYSITESKPSLKGKQFMNDNYEALRTNFYNDKAACYDALFELHINQNSFDGIHVTAAESATLYEKFCISTYDTSILKPDYSYDLATITVDKPVILDTQFFIYGLATNDEGDESIYDETSGKYVDYKDGWLLEPGKTYIYRFSAYGEDDDYNDGRYYTETAFLVSELKK